VTLHATLIDVEAMDLDELDRLAPRWVSAVVIYDSDLEYEWSRDRENDSNTVDVKIFR
jgi:hypothetical protein